MKKLAYKVLLKTAAEKMEHHHSESIAFPGWDKASTDLSNPWRHAAIKRAARAILAENLSHDESAKCSIEYLGCLVRYIADMMEV